MLAIDAKQNNFMTGPARQSVVILAQGRVATHAVFSDCAARAWFVMAGNFCSAQKRNANRGIAFALPAGKP
ncbi:MAG TPA: hypothetical protein VGN04_16705 [Herbaspirillum sp.]